jgi:hypothetical protein
VAYISFSELSASKGAHTLIFACSARTEPLGRFQVGLPINSTNRTFQAGDEGS